MRARGRLAPHAGRSAAPCARGGDAACAAGARGFGSAPRPGATIEAVDALGKYLRIRFSGGIELQTHLRMNGRWYLQRRGPIPGERGDPATSPGAIRVSPQARVVLETDEYLAVCVRAPVVRLVRVAPGVAAGVAAPVPASLAHLGPDLCRLDADLDAAVARLATHAVGSAEIGEVLLDQRVMAGIGNVFKSEVCFACGVDPFRRLETIDLDVRGRLVRTAARQLRANIRPGRRTTVPGGLAVYGREHQPCLRCTTLIRAGRQGADRRVTYWCPGCQH